MLEQTTNTNFGTKPYHQPFLTENLKPNDYSMQKQDEAGRGAVKPQKIFGEEMSKCLR